MRARDSLSQSPSIAIKHSASSTIDNTIAVCFHFSKNNTSLTGTYESKKSVPLSVITLMIVSFGSSVDRIMSLLLLILLSRKIFLSRQAVIFGYLSMLVLGRNRQWWWCTLQFPSNLHPPPSCVGGLTQHVERNQSKQHYYNRYRYREY